MVVGDNSVSERTVRGGRIATAPMKHCRPQTDVRRKSTLPQRNAKRDRYGRTPASARSGGGRWGLQTTCPVTRSIKVILKPHDTRTRLPLQFAEFIALMALLMSMTAMSIDIMLPALPDIGATLGEGDDSKLPLVVTVFMFGMAIGQVIWGPLADRFGRRGPLLLGLLLFASATTIALTTQSFSQLLAARFLQGIGGSVGRIIVTAIVRDLFVGREMARVMSMVMMAFILVPILAPSVGQIILLVATWRWLFAVLLGASLTALIWAWSRLPETQAPLAPGAYRRTLGAAMWLVLSQRATFGYGIASGFVLGILVAYISSAQQVFGKAYGL